MRRLAELLQQLRSRQGALHEDRIVERHLRNALHGAKRRVAGEQDKCAAMCALENLHHLFADGAGELRRSRVGHLFRQVQHGLALEVELRRELDFVG